MDRRARRGDLGVSRPRTRRRAGAPAAALAAGLAALALLALAPRAARATLEQYNTFDLLAEEEDDESLLDHVLTRPPSEWREEWERAPQAFRTAQGCLTSSQWMLVNQLKTGAPLGSRARFDLDLDQTHTNEVDVDVLTLGFRFPTPLGTAAAEFQPSYDKSRQDLVLAYELGADTTGFSLQAAWGLEDVFNNLWAFRQSRVGERSEPYTRHPYEPRLRLGARGTDWRATIGGRWMTPSEKRLVGGADPASDHLQRLWGTLAWAEVAARALGTDWTLSSSQQQVATDDTPVSGPPLDGREFRRKWSVEFAARRALTRRVAAELRTIYQSRTQTYGAVYGPAAFGALDRLAQLDLAWAATPRLTYRLGALYDRISIGQQGAAAQGGYGSRKESRAYLGLMARFGRVVVQGVEGIELDREPYDVWLVHDKGFVQLQTTF